MSMGVLRSAAGILAAFLLAGCSVTGPVRQPTLQDEASRHLLSFERNMKLGRYQAAYSDAVMAVDTYRLLDRDGSTALALNNLGTVQERFAMMDKARASFMEAVELSRDAGPEGVLAASLNNLAGMMAETDPDGAEELAREAHDMGLDLSAKGARARALQTLARVALARGDYENAGAYCDRAIGLAGGPGEKGVLAACLVTRGRILAAQGSGGAALEVMGQALQIDRELSDPYAIAMDHRRMAEVLRSMGDQEEAAKSDGKADRILAILGIRSAPGSP